MKLKGVVHCLMDQGESAAWQFQDARFIVKNTTHFRCSKCSKYWDKTKNPDAPVPGDMVFKRSKITEHGIEDLGTETVPSCPSDEHDFEPAPPTWFHFGGGTYLGDGDQLIIYDKDDTARVLWKGTMRFGRPYSLWKTPDEEGISRADWAKWFFGQYPAELIRA